jgi:hypothetical protein
MQIKRNIKKIMLIHDSVLTSMAIMAYKWHSPIVIHLIARYFAAHTSPCTNIVQIPIQRTAQEL